MCHLGSLLALLCCFPGSCAPGRGRGKQHRLEEEVTIDNPSPHQAITASAAQVDTICGSDVKQLLEQYPVKKYKKVINTRLELNRFVDHMKALTDSLQFDQKVAHDHHQLGEYKELTRQLQELKPYVSILRDAHEQFQATPLHFVKGTSAASAAAVKDQLRGQTIDEIMESINKHSKANKLFYPSSSIFSKFGNFKSSMGSSSSSSHSNQS